MLLSRSIFIIQFVAGIGRASFPQGTWRKQGVFPLPLLPYNPWRASLPQPMRSMAGIAPDPFLSYIAFAIWSYAQTAIMQEYVSHKFGHLRSKVTIEKICVNLADDFKISSSGAATQRSDVEQVLEVAESCGFEPPTTPPPTPSLLGSPFHHRSSRK